MANISFQYKGKNRLIPDSDETFNNFEVVVKLCKSIFSKADLILEMQWLWLCKTKIDMKKEGIRIYGNFIPFCKDKDNGESFYNSNSESSEEKIWQYEGET
ncbi:14179_t:CDS:2 [Funneliformis geosporum]|uniref:14179_t:CDS:1 n=1 Tax=Funneliformis geosporum TaxID=1117311 RepID=A0A9W4SPR8_9GLOM|nr:14179_t:CDS:2 [Funneliformis geosporum]